jgi:hypothetical protein
MSPLEELALLTQVLAQLVNFDFGGDMRTY